MRLDLENVSNIIQSGKVLRKHLFNRTGNWAAFTRAIAGLSDAECVELLGALESTMQETRNLQQQSVQLEQLQPQIY